MTQHTCLAPGARWLDCECAETADPPCSVCEGRASLEAACPACRATVARTLREVADELDGRAVTDAGALLLFRGLVRSLRARATRMEKTKFAELLRQRAASSRQTRYGQAASWWSHGISTEKTIWCGVCSNWNQQGAGGHVAHWRKAGWRRTKEHGWMCPACVRAARATRMEKVK